MARTFDPDQLAVEEVVLLDLEQWLSDQRGIIGLEAVECALDGNHLRKGQRTHLRAVSGSRSAPSGDAMRPPFAVATIAMESVSQKAQETPLRRTSVSRTASTSWAAAVISAAMGGK